MESGEALKEPTANNLKPGDVIEFVSSLHLLSASRGTHLRTDRCVVKYNWPDHPMEHHRGIRIEDAPGSPFHFWIWFSWNDPNVVVRFEGSRNEVVVPWFELFKKVKSK